MKTWLLLIGLLSAFSLNAATHRPEDFFKSIQGRPDQGKQIVEHFCLVCHATTPEVQLGAPRIGVAADWKERLKQGKEVLFTHTNLGMGAMPPRGGCFECSDSQLQAAIEYLITPQSP